MVCFLYESIKFQALNSIQIVFLRRKTDLTLTIGLNSEPFYRSTWKKGENIWMNWCTLRYSKLKIVVNSQDLSRLEINQCTSLSIIILFLRKLLKAKLVRIITNPHLLYQFGLTDQWTSWYFHNHQFHMYTNNITQPLQ